MVIPEVETEASLTQATIDSPKQRVADLRVFFNPRSIAVIGATERPGSVGGAVLRNLIEGGFKGALFPINPNRESVFGLTSYPDVAQTARDIDLAVVCTPAATVQSLVRQCGECGVGGMLILSAGFRETGGEGIALENAIRAELKQFPRMRIVGPNCVGLVVPSSNLNASFTRSSARAGNIALLSQSGALCAAILGWANDEGIGFSHFISVGNMLDVGFGDLLDALADDPQAASVVMYVEAISDAPRFIEAAKRCTARKPVIVYKAGRSAAAARAASSHTGAMAGEDAVYQAAFDECGIIRVNRLDDLLSTAELLGRGRWPNGPRLGIVTNAGGPGVIAADALHAGKGVLAPLAAETMTALNTILPSCWSHANPVDIIGDASSERLASALEAVINDDNVDAALAIVTPQAMIDVTTAARAVTAVATRSPKPILAAWMGGSLAKGAVAVFQVAGIPTYATPEQAVDAFLHLATHARHQQARVVEQATELDQLVDERGRSSKAAMKILDGRHGTLSEVDSKSLLSIYGISVTRTVAAQTREQAIAAATEIGFPVVIKVLSPQITHKTEVDGVRRDLRTVDDVASAFDHVKELLARHRPDAQFDGVTVQRMLDRSRGLELIIGVKRDATFGPIVLVGAGGITAEAMNDRAIGLAPVTIERAHEMLRSLRIWPLLEDFRSRGPLNVEALANAVVRISHLIANTPDIQEAETNPILVMPDGVIALDARVVLMP